MLSGQVRRLGEQFHVTAELSSASNDAVLWSYSKDSRTADAFALQRELVDSIIARFQIAPRRNVTGDATDAAVPAAAHDYVLRGRFASNFVTLDGLTSAVALFDSALTISPNYVDAYLGKAWNIDMMGDSFESPRTVIPRAQATLGAVARLDSSRADFWVFRSILAANWIWNWPQIRLDVARARAIEPLNVNALFSEALARLASGSGSAFLATMDTTGRSDPLSPLPPLIHVH